MKSFVYVFALAIIINIAGCHSNTNKTIQRKNPAEMNLGYKFDSSKYIKELAWKDSVYKNSSFRNYEKTEFVNESLGKVKEILGTPEFEEIENLEYGFLIDSFGDYTFGLGVCLYMSSESEIIESQSCYRCMQILNKPHSTIVKSTWRDSIRYVELYFMADGQDTIAFDGFQASPSFYWGI